MHNHTKLWLKFNFFQSASSVQRYLKNSYTQLENSDAERKSYDNCYPFMYYLEQAEAYYDQASKSSFSIKPVLLFYGLVHLLKACILTVDPIYPASTSVLAHGVSTRKRKKRDYQFFHDEVKIQKNGLCTHFVKKMFQLDYLDGEKFQMGDLFALVPELDDLFAFIYGKSNMFLLRKEDAGWHIPTDAAFAYHMNNQRLKQYLEEKQGSHIPWIQSDKSDLIIDGKLTEMEPPFRYHYLKETFGIGSSRESLSVIPDLLVHYLLLYNLSMIARYETEWWFDLMKTAADQTYPFIKTFLEITEIKAPSMILQFLMKKCT